MSKETFLVVTAVKKMIADKARTEVEIAVADALSTIADRVVTS